MYNSKYNPVYLCTYILYFYEYKCNKRIYTFIGNLNVQNVYIKKYKIFSIKFHFSNYIHKTLNLCINILVIKKKKKNQRVEILFNFALDIFYFVFLIYPLFPLV